MPKSKANKPSRNLRKKSARKKRGSRPEGEYESTALTTRSGTATEHHDLAIGSGLDRVDALGRATSSLVTHVLSAAREQSRDPAEHVLDVSRAHYHEGAGERTMKLRCDGCGVLSPGASTHELAAVAARALGWISTDGHDGLDQCPACRPDAPKLLPGQVTAEVPKALLSSPELILMSRLEYFANRIVDGTSPRAALINSRSSGHRHMLSEFCKGFEYDATKIFTRLEELAARGVSVPPFYVEKDQEWFQGLFELVKSEDQGDP